MIETRFLASCDADDNDQIDFVVSATSINTVFLYTTLGSESFFQQTINDDLLGANALHCADIEGDQQDELFGIASLMGNIYSEELNGVNKQLIANSRDGYVSVNAAIFDDLSTVKTLTQSYYQSRNLLYQPNQTNDENVVWENFPDGAYHVDAGDINSDADQDVIVASFRDNTVYWLDNKQGGFILRVISTIVDAPQSVVVGDIDKDGDLDVVSTGARDNGF